MITSPFCTFSSMQNVCVPEPLMCTCSLLLGSHNIPVSSPSAPAHFLSLTKKCVGAEGEETGILCVPVWKIGCVVSTCTDLSLHRRLVLKIVLVR